MKLIRDGVRAIGLAIMFVFLIIVVGISTVLDILFKEGGYS